LGFVDSGGVTDALGVVSVHNGASVMRDEWPSVSVTFICSKLPGPSVLSIVERGVEKVRRSPSAAASIGRERAARAPRELVAGVAP
jgi:hypothetical protein